jgi:hypothetical protein
MSGRETVAVRHESRSRCESGEGAQARERQRMDRSIDDQHESLTNQPDDPRPVLVQRGGVEQRVGRGQPEFVRDVEIVQDQRAVMEAGRETDIHIAEGRGMGERRRCDQ